MTRTKDLDELRAALVRSGAVVTLTGGGHWKVTDPRTGATAHMSSTPGDFRAGEKAAQAIKRAGFTFTFRGKHYVPRSPSSPESPPPITEEDTPMTSLFQLPDVAERDDTIVATITAYGAPMRASEVADLTGFDKRVIRNALARMTRSGRLEKPELGLYALPGTVEIVAVEPEAVVVNLGGSKPAVNSADHPLTSVVDAPRTEPRDLVLSTLRDAASKLHVRDIVRVTRLSRKTVEGSLRSLVSSGEVASHRGALYSVAGLVEPEPHLSLGAAIGESPTVDTADGGMSDADLNDLLDALLPGGFKARHLPAIEAWKAATRTLLEAVAS